ncbi:unnamed protein product [Ixodes persulcatus]
MPQLCARVEPDMSEVDTRLTHVGAVARHALLAMPSHPLPGFATSPSAAAVPVPVAEPEPDVSQMLYGGGTTRAPTTQEKATTEMISILHTALRS